MNSGENSEKKKRSPAEIINTIHILYSHHCTTLYKNNMYQKTMLYFLSGIKLFEKVNCYVLKHKNC